MLIYTDGFAVVETTELDKYRKAANAAAHVWSFQETYYHDAAQPLLSIISLVPRSSFMYEGPINIRTIIDVGLVEAALRDMNILSKRDIDQRGL